MHKERMRNVRSMIDTSEPLANQMEHVRNNLKREQLLEERYSEIDRENRILLNKMSTIMKQPQHTQQQPQPQPPIPQPPLTDRTHDRRGPTSLNRDLRKKELHRITHENQQILRRIQQAQPVYNHVEWEGDYRRNHTYLQNCSEYPLVLRKKSPRQAPTSELIPLNQASKSGDLSARSVQSNGEPRQAGSARIVLKDGMRIGPQYYLVEMLTDGRTLYVSAYEGNSQTTLSLVVKESAHRKLLRECNGDYQRIAYRLHIEDGCLKLDPPHASPSPAAEDSSSVVPQQPKTGWAAPEELDADDMVAARISPDSAGSAYAQVDFNSTDDVQVRFRGLTPTSRASDDIAVDVL